MESFDEAARANYTASLARVLGVDASRIRIVRVTEGSVRVETEIFDLDSDGVSVAEAVRGLSASQLSSELGMVVEQAAVTDAGKSPPPPLAPPPPSAPPHAPPLLAPPGRVGAASASELLGSSAVIALSAGGGGLGCCCLAAGAFFAWRACARRRRSLQAPLFLSGAGEAEEGRTRPRPV